MKGGNMPRIARKEINSSYLHVMIQGIEKRNIFNTEKNKKYYKKLLFENVTSFDDIFILAYCIMDNHIHLLIHCKNINHLSKLMSQTNTSYALWYNKCKNRVGYVFRNRYHIQIIESQQHLFNCLVYIHNNPVKANIVHSMEEYQFSSYNMYKNFEVKPEVIKLIFDDTNYINQFNSIHKNLGILKMDDIIDIVEPKTPAVDLDKIITEFCINNQLTLDLIRHNNCFLISLVNEIKKYTNYNNKEISEYLKIGKNRIRNILRKD